MLKIEKKIVFLYLYIFIVLKIIFIIDSVSLKEREKNKGNFFCFVQNQETFYFFMACYVLYCANLETVTISTILLSLTVDPCKLLSSHCVR